MMKIAKLDPNIVKIQDGTDLSCSLSFMTLVLSRQLQNANNPRWKGYFSTNHEFMQGYAMFLWNIKKKLLDP